ncbi:hypothetical protein [Paenibacillus hubeiensis]|uniref:hypothetical protein n=1 Tax=Paenibacillus hubeiensis TaxID=3077330 RepID=UPI0031BA395D
MGRLSISQKLRKASSDERRAELAKIWADEWKAEYEKNVRLLEQAIINKDYDLLARTTGWIKADGNKRFEALPKIMSTLAQRENQ